MVRFVIMPKQQPNKGPYVNPATFRIISMMDLLSITLKAITIKKKMAANVKCTVSRVRFFCLSVRFSFLFSPNISIQKDEVSAVKAPSALGREQK
jgi:hypothetical protein